MSYALKVTGQDVLAILRAHRLASHIHEDAVSAALDIIKENMEQVEEAADEFYEAADRHEAAMDEMETILMEEGVITSAYKRFFSPEADSAGLEKFSNYGSYSEDYEY